MASSPTDIQTQAEAGVAALRAGNAAAARTAFEAVVATGRATPQLWLLLAQSCEALGDWPAVSGAVDRVLAVDHTNLYAMTMKGDALAAQGDDRAATGWYGQAIRIAAEQQGLPADLLERLRRAADAKAATDARFEAHLQAALDGAGATRPPRFAEAIDIMTGRKQPYFQEPKSFFYPGLPHTAFYEPHDFPWLVEIEAMADAIRAEAESVLADDSGTVPYIERPKDRPARPHALLDDTRWSAFHLWKSGEPVAANAARCPVTMAALAKAPIPRIAGRSPMALFSILKPGTHIEPHSGYLNTRLICHIPLIVPEGCRLRVGNQTRTVEAGKALLFDDSIEHEAWNDGTSARAILLFEVWRPELSEAERQALTAMFDAIGGYGED
ncbi:aspartyl/asparaginyl beta-hydroxylase domain-containing protein [Sphingoaurantiacus capsulatus]|uniref:Aspartyl/asparaginyl beta-hydroxylase domain-containing protein n=1 Tax=Sphingoaurantiacus capsulatus TaxID=1771310 RepID=A0ABV7XDL6_9SPHN